MTYLPGLVVLVVGTGTDVGKTWVTAALARSLQAQGLAVAARKPVQSFTPGADPTDADVLGEATGVPATDVCPPSRWYGVPMAPPMATQVLGRPSVSVDDLADGIVWPDTTDVGLVESVGGVRSPLAEDGDSVDLSARLRPDVVVLVADAGLGTINAVRLSSVAFTDVPIVVHLNRFDGADDLHVRNADWLRARDGFDVTTDVEAVAARVRDQWRAKVDG